MPASLYRLANKPHYTEHQASATVVASELPAQPVAVEDPVINVIEQPTVEPVISDDPPVAVEPVTTTQAPVWDSAWTKAQLLDVATQLGLEVTLANTKAQIIEALTAATSS
jgi:hypothetical protein